MARSLWTFAMSAVLLSLASAATAQDSIAWTTNLRAAQEAANREGKLILVHFYADNCPPCRALERNVFPRPEVAAAIHRNYVPLKVHVAQDRQLAERFRVEAWPTDLILTSAALEVTRTISPKLPIDYVTMLDQIAFQSGVGLGRQSEALATQPAINRDVTLTAATSPMAPANDNTQVAGPAAGSTSPGHTLPYDPRGYAPSTPSGLPAANPYSGAPAPQRQAVPPSTGNVAPHTAAFLQAAAARGSAGTQQRTTQPAAGQLPAASGRSIYDEPATPQQVTAPDGYSPDLAASRPSNAASPAQAGSIYDMTSRPAIQPPVARPQQPPQASQQRSPYSPQAQGAPPTQQASAQFQQLRSIPVEKAPPAAIDGFCPVTILESTKWRKGDVRFGAIHCGRTYLFASQEAQRKFLADPQRFAPVLSGCDPVLFAETNQLIDGNHNIGVLLGGKTYFFTSEESRRRFELSPHVYIARADQAMTSGQLRTR